MTVTYPLGRKVNHDPRSLDFPAATSPDHKPVTHRHYGPVLDQGQVGSCTGNAMAQALNTAPLRHKGPYLTEKNALALYSQATQLDPYPGTYPPTDTGSDGLSVCKAAQAQGWISSYTHAFGLDHALGALQLGPVLVGTSWHQGMFTPDGKGFVHPDGNIAGGHEYLLIGDDAKGKLTFLNSWSAGWGKRGRFYMTYADFSTLLNDKGDVTAPVKAS